CTLGDSCAGGECVAGTTVDCSDGNVCTFDFCDAAGDCQHGPAAGDCDDGDACTAGDSCVAGACQGAATTACDDGNACTIDLCDPVSGCSNQDADGAACEDDDPCTTTGTCFGGTCSGGAPK